MPIANKYSLSEIMPAIEYYFEKTGRRVTFEYSVVEGVNDNKTEAMELVKLIRSMKNGGKDNSGIVLTGPYREEATI